MSYGRSTRTSFVQLQHHTHRLPRRGDSQLAASLPGAFESADERTEPGRVDERDRREVDDDVRRTAIDRLVDAAPQVASRHEVQAAVEANPDAPVPQIVKRDLHYASSASKPLYSAASSTALSMIRS